MDLDDGVTLRAAHDPTIINCRDVAIEATGTGALGVMGNKGACCIRLKAFDSTLCFVSSHLAAHRDHVAQRNSDFKAICDRTEFIHARGPRLRSRVPAAPRGDRRGPHLAVGF